MPPLSAAKQEAALLLAAKQEANSLLEAPPYLPPRKPRGKPYSPVYHHPHGWANREQGQLVRHELPWDGRPRSKFKLRRLPGMPR